MQTFYLKINAAEYIEIYASNLIHARISARLAGYWNSKGFTTKRPNLDKAEITMVLNAPNN